MKRNRFLKLVLCLGTVFILIATCAVVSFTHSGYTDADGGHYDESTGEYHYHHGYPAHSHVGGCPYDYDDAVEYNHNSYDYGDNYDSADSSESNFDNREINIWPLNFVLIFHCILIFGLYFVTDTPKIFELDISYKEPTLNDIKEDLEKELKRGIDIYSPDSCVGKYIKENINPYVRFKELEAELRNYQVGVEDTNPVYWILGCIVSFLAIIAMALKSNIFENGLFNFLLGVALAVIGFFIMKLVYKRNGFKLPKKNYYEHIYNRNFTFYPEKYNYHISKETAHNNIIIYDYHRELYKLADTIRFRHYVRKLIGGLIFILLLIDMTIIT